MSFIVITKENENHNDLPSGPAFYVGGRHQSVAAVEQNDFNYDFLFVVYDVEPMFSKEQIANDLLGLIGTWLPGYLNHSYFKLKD